MADIIDLSAKRRSRGFSVLLPLPPTENVLTKNVPGRGRAKTDEYKAWIQDAGWAIKEAKPCAYDVPVQIHVYIRPRTLKSGKPALHGSDAPNYLKALYDLLTPPKGRKKHGMGLIPDDNMAWLKHGSYTVVEHDELEHALPPGWCRVVLKPLEES